MVVAKVWLASAALVVTALVAAAALFWPAASGLTAPPLLPASPGAGPGETPDAATTPSPWHPAPVFDDTFLVAYYGTAGTDSLGVLGDGSIAEVTDRLRAAAAPYAAASGKRVQIVYELIATVADGTAGADGTYSHDIPRTAVEAYMAAARRNHALLVLDLQPGRSDFLTVAKRYAWALKEPYVGLALDPEWRMGPGEVPAHVFGSVTAAEVNETAAFTAGIARRNRLPQKLFVIHQFTPSMVRGLADIAPLKGLAIVQHVDGWGDRQNKLATLHNVARPGRFVLGFKLFYREDVDMFTPRSLLRAVPRVQFVSYQ